MAGEGDGAVEEGVAAAAGRGPCQVSWGIGPVLADIRASLDTMPLVACSFATSLAAPFENSANLSLHAILGSGL